MGFAAPRGEPAWRRWRERIAYPLETDPGGAFVAERDGQVIGVAEAVQRSSLWVLSFLAVDPQAQGAGAGRALMRAALGYGDPRRGLIVASDHAAALGLYERAGFVPRRALRARGRVDHGARRDGPCPVRPGTEADLELAAAISVEQRGASHPLGFALRRGGQLLVVPGRGFTVAQPGYGVWVLAARDEEAAAALLWRGLHVAGAAEQYVRWITADNRWAVPVLEAAGLELTAYGAVCVRGDVGPLAPYLPSAPFA